MLTPLFILPVSVGLTLLIAGFVLMKFPPKNINGLYGYRTQRSMKSQKSWDFAQKYSARLMMIFGAVYCFLSLLAFVVELSESAEVIIGMVPAVVFVAILFVKTERALKEYFE